MKALAAILILLAGTSSAQACGPGTVSGQSWFRDKNALRSHGPLPVAEATAELLHRPPIVQPGQPVGCDQFARFVIRVQLDPSTTSQPSDYGYLFHVRTRNAPLNTIPDRPVQANVVDGFAEFEVEVYDFGVGPRSSIDLDVEIRAVDRRLRRGPKSIFRLQAKPISQPAGT